MSATETLITLHRKRVQFLIELEALLEDYLKAINYASIFFS